MSVKNSTYNTSSSFHDLCERSPLALYAYRPIVNLHDFTLSCSAETEVTQPSKLKFLLGRHMTTNPFGLGRLFTNQVTSSKILGTMATKMVATWTVVTVTVPVRVYYIQVQ